MCPFARRAAGRPLRRSAAVAVLFLASATCAWVDAEPVSAQSSVSYEPPVDAMVVDPFRPPAGPYGAGNRGIDYATLPGQAVRAAAAGTVVFSGSVAGSRHVVLLHDDGIRTTYAFLASVDVRRGAGVAQGQQIGSAASFLHFGARAGDVYLDPALLLGGGPLDVHLVPHDGRATSAADERRGVVASLRHWGASAASAVVAGAGWGVDAHAWASDAAGEALRTGGDAARVAAVAASTALRAEMAAQIDRLLLLGHYAYAVSPLALADLAVELSVWWASQEGCTPADAPTPRVVGRRIVVLVAGFGSRAGDASILAVDTATLGYDPDDVAQFSYRGGRVPGVGALDGVPVNAYEPADSHGDIREAGRALRDLLSAVRHAHPGVAVDLIAHSQGGLVVRAALGDEIDAHAPRLPEINAVVTIASPHQGADLATALALSGTTGVGAATLAGVDAVAGAGATSPAGGQMSETSSFLRDLNRRPVPDDLPFTSIAARGDLVVAAPRTQLAGATNVVVPVDGLHAHSDVTASPLTQREIALALAGVGPSCRGLGEVVFDGLVGNRIGLMEDGLGLLVGSRLALLDQRLPPALPVLVPTLTEGATP